MLNLSGIRIRPTILSALVLFILPSLLLISVIDASPSAEASPGNELYLTILHTNDEHSSLIPHSPAVDFHPERENPTIGGYARLASAVNEIRERKNADGEPVLLLSAGDYIGGSPYSWLIPQGYAPEIKLKQAIGYDAVVIGNHEYDYGPDILAGYFLEAGYPGSHEQTVVLASNTAAPLDHPLESKGLYRDSHIIELDNGLKVGLFGLIGKDAVSVTAPHDPVEFSDQHETARKMVDYLQQQGAQFIVAITHSGVGEDQDLGRDVPGINVIVGGHCHTALYEPVIENGTVIVQAGSLLEYLGQLELAFNPSTGEVRIRNEENSEPFLLKLDYNIPLDPETDEAIVEYTVQLNALIAEKTGGRFQHVLDTVMLSDFKVPKFPPLRESPFGNFVTDAIRLLAWEKTGHRADFAVQANGLIRGSITPGTMPHALGKVSVYDLTELVGLGVGPDGVAGYPLVAVYLTGDEIRRVLEVAVLLSEMMGDGYFLQFSGLRYDYNPQNAILFTVPFLDLPIPTTRAVISAERYTGDGRQGVGDELYEPLEWGNKDLYCLVTDSYILSFLPMVGEMLPQLDLVLKDRDGNFVPQEDLDDLIVHVDGEELKVWAAILEYAATQPVGDSGLPEIDDYYATTAGRINPTRTIPLVTWPILILLVLIAGIIVLIRRRRLRKRLNNR